MNERTAVELSRELIAKAKNQYREGHFDASMLTMLQIKDLYREAWQPMPTSFDATVAMVQEAIDKVKLKDLKW